MISKAEQSELIVGIHNAGGFVNENFTSAAGIDGNFKIQLPEALRRDESLKAKFVGYLAAELTEVDVIAAVGGAVYMAQEVAEANDLPFIKIGTKTTKGVKNFSLTKGNGPILAQKPRIGFVEDISSTWQTVDRAVRQTRLKEMITIAISGWRRGEPAPEGMTPDEIMDYNRQYPFRHLYEIPLGFPIQSIIHRVIPLWLPTRKMVSSRLHELPGTV